MNMNQNDKVFQNYELNFHREKENVWGPHVSDTIFLIRWCPFITLADEGGGVGQHLMVRW